MKTLLACILVSFAFVTSAQKNFVAGSVTLPSGTSEKGFIDYREWKMNPQKILFRKMSGIWVDYTSDNVLEFRIDYKNEIYKQAIFQNNADTAIKPKSLFLLTLIQGKINLYSYHDTHDDAHFFVQKDDGLIYELIYKGAVHGYSYAANPNQNAFYVIPTFADSYKKQLLKLMEDCPQLHQEIQILILSENSIFNLVKKYNIKKDDLGYVKPKDQATNSINIMAGATYSDMIVEEYFTGYNKKDHIGTITHTFNIGFEHGVPRSNGRFTIGIDAIFQQNTSHFTLNNRNIVKQYTLDISGIRLNGFGKYILHKGRWAQPYIKGGIGTSYYFKNQMTTYIESSINSLRTRKLSRFDPSLFGGLGLKVHSLFIETRYELGSNLDYTAGEKFKINRASVVAGFSLKLNK